MKSNNCSLKQFSSKNSAKFNNFNTKTSVTFLNVECQLWVINTKRTLFVKEFFCINDPKLALGVQKSYRGFYVEIVIFFRIFGGKLFQNAIDGLQNVPKCVLYYSPIQQLSAEGPKSEIHSLLDELEAF